MGVLVYGGMRSVRVLNLISPFPKSIDTYMYTAYKYEMYTFIIMHTRVSLWL